MNPRPKRKGPLARFLEGMDAKTVTILVVGLAGVGGVKVNSDHKVTEIRQEVAHRDTAQMRSRGRLRLSLDTLRTQFAAEKDRSRRVERALRNEIAALKRARPAAPEFQGSRQSGDPGDAEMDADDELIGPPEPPAQLEKPQ